MDTVPPELLPEILKFLALDDLRRAAAVSRVFNASAWLSGLLITHRIHWLYGENYDAEVDAFSEIVHHALRKGLRLSLGVMFRFGPSGVSDDDEAIPSTSLERFLSLITGALPIVHTLRLTLRNWVLPSLTGALRFAAPNLRELYMAVEGRDETFCLQIPPNMFAGSAPKLRHVGLWNLHLGRHPVAAFAHVTSVQLEYLDRNSELDFALHFPCMRSLHLSFFKVPAAPPPAAYRLDGLGLRRLIVDEYDPPMLIPAILRFNTLVDIPIVRYSGDSMRCGEPIWHKTDDGPFKIFLTGSVVGSWRNYGPARVIVAQQNRHWLREFTLRDWQLHLPCPITAIPRLAERLGHLRMRNLYVVGFLECSGISLDVLRELRIDFHADTPHDAMVWPPDWSNSLGDWVFSFGLDDASTPTFASASYSVIACRALETLVLAAVSAEVSVNSQEVAFLGRALSQCLRPKQDRAALELVGIELREPVTHALLDQTFSTVRRYGFAGTDYPPGRDDDIWDEEL